MLIGRVYSHRSAGMKLLFIDLHQDGKSIQIVCNYAKIQGQASEADYQGFFYRVQRGDIYSTFGILLVLAGLS